MEEIRVVEFGCYYAAPMLTRFLAGFGARVTSVVRPLDVRGARAERARMGGAFSMLRAEMEVVELRLPDELARAHALVARADVIVENFAPGVMTRLGLGVEACRAIRPEVIYVSLPGFDPGTPSLPGKGVRGDCACGERGEQGYGLESDADGGGGVVHAAARERLCAVSRCDALRNLWRAARVARDGAGVGAIGNARTQRMHLRWTARS